MYKRVLAYIDGSFGHEVAARYALALAKASGARCLVAASFEGEGAHAKSASSAQRLSIQAADMGLELETHLREGPPLGAGRSLLRELRPDLIVGSLDGGDVTERGVSRDSTILRLSDTVGVAAVFARVVNCGLAFSHQKVLLPVHRALDLSSPSADMVSLLVELTKVYDAELGIFSCVETSAKKQYGPEELASLRYQRRTELKPLVEEIMDRGIRPGLRIKTCASPASEILDLVSRERYDLIIARAPRQSLLSILRGPQVIEEVLLGTPSNVLLWSPGV